MIVRSALPSLTLQTVSLSEPGTLSLVRICRDDDAFELAGDFLNAFDFESEHGEPLGQFLRRPVEINVLFEPVKGDFHAQNCFKNRRSFS